MRKSVLAVAVLAIVVLGGQAALADNPHFQKATASLSGSNLVVSFREVGLGNTASEADITASADASATYGCVNGGGKHPSAANKETVTSPVSNSGTFAIRNGAASGSITVAPPGPGDFSCPDDMTLALLSVTYSNITVSGGGTSQSTTPNQLTYTA